MQACMTQFRYHNSPFVKLAPTLVLASVFLLIVEGVALDFQLELADYANVLMSWYCPFLGAERLFCFSTDLRGASMLPPFLQCPHYTSNYQSYF